MSIPLPDFSMVWAAPGTRRFHYGVFRGALYPKAQDQYGEGVPWNGLTGVQATSGDGASTILYLDGVPYRRERQTSKTSISLSAYTYPDEFESCLSREPISPGGLVHDQYGTEFGLAYCTLIGSDLDAEAGFQLHLVYNCYVDQNDVKSDSISSQVNTSAFSWKIDTIPESVPGFAPVSRLTFDSTKEDPGNLTELMSRLYGAGGYSPSLPPISEVIEIMMRQPALRFAPVGFGAFEIEGEEPFLSPEGADAFELNAPTVIPNVGGDSYRATNY